MSTDTSSIGAMYRLIFLSHIRLYRKEHRSLYEKKNLKPFSQILQDSPDQAAVISLYHAVIFVKKGAVSQFSQV
ncbi:hypothetical protein KIPB_016689, partial [Kipferlia bialata]|eukprot:g16689.t1